MISLADVRKCIAETGLSWDATETELSRAAAREGAAFRRLGFAPRGREPAGGAGRQSRQAFAFAAGDLPKSVDWRSVNGEDWTTPVRDQGTCGSCVAFATCAVLETRAKIKVQNPNLDISLSVAHLFFCNGPRDGCDLGWQPGSALLQCRDQGVPAEASFRYARPRELRCTARLRSAPPIVKAPRWRRLHIKNSDHLVRKRAIVERGPVIAGMIIYGDFLYYRGGQYRPVTDEALGLHAVAVVGYDDAKATWLIKNSWGTAWGEGGYAQVGYGTCGLGSQFDFYDPEVDYLPHVSTHSDNGPSAS
jgi:C1A family cysteine protease